MYRKLSLVCIPSRVLVFKNLMRLCELGFQNLESDVKVIGLVT